MTEPQQQCENCLKLFPESKMATHFGYCRRNIKKCGECGEMYDINNKEEHDEEFHKKAVCRFCKSEMNPGELKSHEQNCSKRTEYCEYCQLNVPSSQFNKHIKACEARTKKCDRCLKPIANKDYLLHITNCGDFYDKSTGETQISDDFTRNQPTRIPRERIRQKDAYKYQNSKDADFKKKVEDVPAPNRRQQNNLMNKQSEKPANSKPNTNSVPNSLATGHSTKTTSQPRRQIFNPTGIKKNEQLGNQRGAYRPHVTKIEEYQQLPKPEYQAGGIKRQIKETKKELPSYKNVMPATNNIKHEEKSNGSASYQHRESSGRKRERIFDAKQYRGMHSKQIPPEIIEDSFHTWNHRNLQEFDEDQEIQKAIMQSMEQSKKNSFPNFDNIPKELQSQDLMRASWTRDFDIEKQRAIEQDLKRNAKRKFNK